MKAKRNKNLLDRIKRWYPWKKLTQKKKKIFFYSFAIPLCLFLSATLFLPIFLSKKGKDYLLSTLKTKTGLSVEVDSLSLSWFGKQTLHNLCLQTDHRSLEYSFYAELAEIKSSFIGLLTGREPYACSFKNWVLIVKEKSLEKKEETDNPSPCSNSFSSMVNWIKDSRLLSENGIISFYPLREPAVEAKEIYILKDRKYFNVSAKTICGRTPGFISVNSSASSKLDISAKLKSVPLSLFRPFTSSVLWCHLLNSNQYFNQYIDATASVDNQVKEDPIFTASVKSADLSAYIKGILIDNTLILEQNGPSFIEYSAELASKLAKTFLPLEETVSSSKIISKISWAKIPLNFYWLSRSQLEAITTIHNIFITPKHPNLAFALKGLSFLFFKERTRTSTKISGKLIVGENISDIDGISTFDPLSEKHNFSFRVEKIPHHYIRALFPYLTSFDIPLEDPYHLMVCSGFLKTGKFQTNLRLSNPLLDIQSDISGTTSSIKIEGNGNYTFPKNLAEITHLSEAKMNFSGKLSSSETHFYYPKISAKISSGPNEVSLHAKLGKNNSPTSLETSAVLIHGIFKDFPLGGLSNKCQDIVVNEASFSFHTDGSKNLTKGNFKACIQDSSLPNHPPTRILIPEIFITPSVETTRKNTLSSEEPLKKIIGPNSSVSFVGEILYLPISRLCSLLNYTDLSKYLGESGSASISGDYTPNEDRLWLISSSVKTPALSSNFIISTDKHNKLSDKTNGKIIWEITPERYLSFFDSSSCKPLCSLHRTATVQINIEKMSCGPNTSGLSCLTLFGGEVKGNLTTSSMIFYDKISKDSFIINPISGNLQSTNAQNGIAYEIKGNCLSHQQEAKKPSQFLIKGSVDNILSEKGRRFTQTAQWDNIPATFISGIFPISPSVKTQISSLAGTLINVSITHNLFNNEGPITISVDSSNLKAEIPLVMTKNSLLLAKTLTAELQLNDAVNKAFLQEFNPLLSSGGAYSERPITLSVDKHGFSLPIRPYNFSKFQVDQAQLDIGKVHIANKGDITELFQFLGIEEKSEFVESWFTPVFFSVAKGTIYCKRFDALIDHKIRLALWGKTDLIKDRIYMTLGIDPEVIKKYFHNTYLKTRNFFLIKFRGSISSPKADWSSAYARIGLLKNNALGNPIISNLADKIFSSLGDSTPPQTTNPLPWEVHPDYSPSKKKNKNKKQRKRKLK